MQIFVNHKANLNYEEIKRYEEKIRNLDLVVMPSISYMTLFQNGLYKLGSQDISEYKDTNMTGEINARQLKSLNVKYSLIGHSDLRNYKNVTDESVFKKLKICLDNNIIPIYCIGYKDNSDANEIISEINKVLDIIEDNNVIIAYEPKENIGVKSIDLNLINDNINIIRSHIKDKNNIKLLYGGGVNIINVEVIKKFDIDGILLSTESLNIDNLLKIYNMLKK